ncbi:MAG: S1C family serine protease [Anaerolineae bacterium]|jgi:S1-C subfamily serine protease
MDKHSVFRNGWYLVLALAIALLGIGWPALSAAGNPSTKPAAVPLAQATPTPSGSFRSLIYEVTDIVKPAVVQVTNEQMIPGSFQPGTAIPAGVGSGIIYDNKGHVLTNNHVVEGAYSLQVSLTDGRTFTATLAGADPVTDLAVLTISGDNLPVAELGDSTKLRVGEWVVAIGNALALPGGPTVTAGVVSALGRVVQEPASSSQGQGPFLFNLIQTDAPINPGNSGGPLVNLDGQVVGINTLGGGQTSQGVQTQNVNFAISIETAKPIADQLVQTGQVVHPYLGAAYVPLTPALIARYGFPVPYGVVVTGVATGSPAAQAGLRAQDLITEADGQALKQESTLAQIIHQHKPGDKLTLSVVRGTQRLTITVTLGQQL